MRGFFFYGTLTHEATHPVARAIHALLGPGQAARTGGTLYAIPHGGGWYPALVPGDGRISGYYYPVVRPIDASDLPRMDAYEAFDPADEAASEYLRRSVVVTLPDGATVDADAYLYARALPPGSRVIPDGDFRAFLRDNGLSAFDPGPSGAR
ncbi:gamma-glutamylcyclotransferase family protein [Novosphingobium tardum]|uniref:Gamma-glutamylcyclotransferase family protein n=1 Tax=Novosphingobium tardum TaxID=1538021 RepID=A0ABV8RMX2_9SPHN